VPSPGLEPTSLWLRVRRQEDHPRDPTKAAFPGSQSY
jgi:hypothetical protein